MCGERIYRKGTLYIVLSGRRIQKVNKDYQRGSDIHFCESHLRESGYNSESKIAKTKMYQTAMSRIIQARAVNVNEYTGTVQTLSKGSVAISKPIGDHPMQSVDVR